MWLGLWGREGWQTPSCVCLPLGRILQRLPGEVAFSAALAAAKYSPGNSYLLAADENAAPSKAVSVSLRLGPAEELSLSIRYYCLIDS